MTGQLGPYSGKSPGIFHCPADMSYVPTEGNRVRSVSMNVYLGSEATNADVSVPTPYWQTRFKMNSIANPTPSMTWVVNDEHPDSINDGSEVITEQNFITEWTDLPASYHNNACGFAFGDGHSEIHKWRNPSTCLAIHHTDTDLPVFIPPGQSADVTWVTQRMAPKLSQ